MRFKTLGKLVDVRDSLSKHGWREYRDYGINSKTDIAIHHSLTEQGSAEAYARYHVHHHGWAGIGYHFVIEKDGTIKWCHDLGIKSYHVGNSNKFAVGVCLTGDFRKGRQKPTDAQKKSLKALVDILKQDLPNFERVRGHNEFDGYSWKNCPGDNWNYKEVLEKTTIPPVAPEPSPDYYVVQPGDTLWGIARAHKGVTVEDLRRYNNIKGSLIRVGQKLILTPTKKVVKPKLPTGVLSAGDTGESVADLQRALNEVYFRCEVDGVYGEDTEDAVRRFQMVYLPYEVDGVYGSNTRTKLLEVLNGEE